MKITIFFSLLVATLIGCSYGHIANKDLSLSNIKSVVLEFPKNNKTSRPISLAENKIELFAAIIKNRKQEFVEPTNCYYISIELKDGSSVHYLTDGINFKGLDDSSDLPFSFEIKENVLKTVFNLPVIDSCK